MARVGVDEAGKGPVLGSMFAAAVRVADGVSLPDGIRDSKDLTPERREELAAALRDREGIETGVAEVPTERIDDPGTDMNTLTVEAQADALGAVLHVGDTVVLDAGDVSEDRFADRVSSRLDGVHDLSAEHGADGAYPIVGAASVVAKVERDAHVRRLAEAFEDDLGSGYPSDGTTRNFLEQYVGEYGELPDCARATWGTSRDVLGAAEQSSFGDF